MPFMWTILLAKYLNLFDEDGELYGVLLFIGLFADCCFLAALMAHYLK